MALPDGTVGCPVNIVGVYLVGSGDNYSYACNSSTPLTYQVSYYSGADHIIIDLIDQYTSDNKPHSIT